MKVLSGLKVLEVAAIGPVPFCGMMLADMGAEVVRVDRPPAYGVADGLAGFDNRGRRSISIDLKHPEAVAIVLGLVEQADVLIEGFRPGVMERLGLGPDACLERNPRLVYGRMTGWGQHGPLAAAAGHDLNYIALTGALHAMGRPDRPPAPPINLVGDYGGGAMMLLTGVLAALHERHRSGRGQVVDAAMSDGVVALMAPLYAMMAQGVWSDRRGSNLLDGSAHYYGVYECADGAFVSVGSIEPQFYRLLLEACGLADQDLPGQNDAAHWPQMRDRFAVLFKTRSRLDWCRLMEGTDACFAPVLSMTEAPHHPHHLARGSFVELDGALQPAPAPRFSRTPSQASAHIPRVGEDSADVLTSAGWEDSEVSRLIAAGAIYCADPVTASV